MKPSIFRCCVTALSLRQYEASTNAVLNALGIGFVDVKEFGCCGYPLKNADFKAYVLASARNLALAGKHGSDALTVCNCCYGSLKHAAHILESDSTLRAQIGAVLRKEGLSIERVGRVRHLLEVLYEDIGPDVIRRSLKKTFDGLKIAVHEGCHLLRPSTVLRFDNPIAPVKFDELVRATGAETVPWSAKLDCCGSPLMGVNSELSLDLMEKKLTSAQRAGADCLCVICPFCHLQFGAVQHARAVRCDSRLRIPSILYPQLLGLALGIDAETLRIKLSRMPPEIERFLR